eukprot:sb/3477503/
MVNDLTPLQPILASRRTDCRSVDSKNSRTRDFRLTKARLAANRHYSNVNYRLISHLDESAGIFPCSQGHDDSPSTRRLSQDRVGACSQVFKELLMFSVNFDPLFLKC